LELHLENLERLLPIC